MPSGLPFMVDGAACTTPCILLNKHAGAQVQVVGPRYRSRRTLTGVSISVPGMAGAPPRLSRSPLAIMRRFSSPTYQAFYKLTVTSQPAGHVSFAFNPLVGRRFLRGWNAGRRYGHQQQRVHASSAGLAISPGPDSTASVVMNAPRFAVAVLDGFPFISENGVKNAAGDTPSGTVGPGSDISIFGENLAVGPESAAARRTLASPRRHLGHRE